MLKKYEFIITRASGKEYKYFRAVQINSLVGMAEDMMEDDWSIKNIFIRDIHSSEIAIVK